MGLVLDQESNLKTEELQLESHPEISSGLMQEIEVLVDQLADETVTEYQGRHLNPNLTCFVHCNGGK